MLIVFVLGFQGVDFFGDIFLSKRLLYNNEKDSETRWLLTMTGILMMIPVVLSTLFMIPHWWKNEEKWWRKVLTFIFIPVYPQYRALRVLFFWCFGYGEKAVQEKERFDNTVSFVGKYSYYPLYFLNPVLTSFHHSRAVCGIYTSNSCHDDII